MKIENHIIGNGWRLCLPFLILLTLYSGSACQSKKEGPTEQELRRRDSLELRVALLPIEACEPLRYAHETGIDDSMGVWLKIVQYDAMMDIDTAVLGQRADVYFMDTVRVARIKVDSVKPRMLMPVPVRLALVANKGKRIRKSVSLKEHIVGSTRWSVVDSWLDNIVDSTRLKTEDVFHAQINSIPLRYRMVRDGLLDAAIIPQPFVDSLRLRGHRIISTCDLRGMGFYTDSHLQNDTARLHRARVLIDVYRQAQSKLKIKKAE